ncbi:hypothetical protein [Brevundimonas sp.]|uniref:hypothetical protein n=1 Tax=Brevundimonas sp. TaxID=1871086 RepID=UPI00391BB49F
MLDVMRCVEDHTASTGRPDFVLDDLYAFEARLSALHPGNRHVREKIRQQLQVLRDRGWLTFGERRGTYRRRG